MEHTGHSDLKIPHIAELLHRKQQQVQFLLWSKGTTYISGESSLLMYSSRMLVSMLDGSRAPLMSWPARIEEMETTAVRRT